MEDNNLAALALSLLAVVLIAFIIAKMYDDFTFLFDPKTGRMGIKATRGDRTIPGGQPPLLEGKS